MRPRIHVVTLAVADLDRALTFYRDGMGFPTEWLIGTEFHGNEDTPDGTTAVFQLDGGLMLSIYPPLRAGQGRQRPADRGEAQRVQHRARCCHPRRGRRGHLSGQGSRGSRHRPAARPAVGHLFRIFPRSRRSPLGDHLESRHRPWSILSGCQSKTAGHNPLAWLSSPGVPGEECSGGAFMAPGTLP